MKKLDLFGDNFPQSYVFAIIQLIEPIGNYEHLKHWQTIGDWNMFSSEALTTESCFNGGGVK